MNALLVTPDRDCNPGDWSGAFAVEAKRFCTFHRFAPIGARLSVNISCQPSVQRKQLLQKLGTFASLDLLIFFCHGTRTGLQVGWSVETAQPLVSALAPVASPGLKIALFACSTAKDDPAQPGTCGDGGFADALRDHLSVARPDWQGWVDGHDRAGHTTSNPYVRRLPAGVGVGGAWLIEPGSAVWVKWSEALEDRQHNTLRLRYPLMTCPEILQELGV